MGRIAQKGTFERGTPALSYKLGPSTGNMCSTAKRHKHPLSRGEWRLFCEFRPFMLVNDGKECLNKMHALKPPQCGNANGKLWITLS